MVALVKKIEGELRELKEKIYFNPVEVSGWLVKRSIYLAPEQYEEFDREWKDIQLGDLWQGDDVTAFFKNTIRLDERFKHQKVVLKIVTGGEACLSINGIPFNGLDQNRDTVLLSDRAFGNEVYDIQIEAYSRSLGTWNRPALDGRLHVSYLACVNEAVKTYYDMTKTAYEFACATENKYIKDFLLDAIYTSLLKVQRSEDAFETSLEVARSDLENRLSEVRNFKLPVNMMFAGHSHIDVAWLWTLDETVRKCSRTFSTTLRLMEQYPFFKFTQSTPQMYAYTKEYYPKIYEQIKTRVQEGRWEAIGGMWIEPDCNLISGESFVRQILYGKQFYEEEFGTETKVCFLPDTFGFPGSLPQILKKAGFDYFFTSKLAWNEVNEFPYSVFNWKGIDGSSVLSAMIEMDQDTYNGQMQIDKLKVTIDKFKQKDGKADLLYLYGFSDGGGGVTPEMLDTLKYIELMPELPACKPAFVEEYFDALYAKDTSYPEWRGELYFEKHRGTFTTQSRNKKWNRKSEFLYRDTEILATIDRIHRGTYGADSFDLKKGWIKLLVNQFHDILPGTSITKVHEQSMVDYAEIIAIANGAKRSSLESLTTESTSARSLTVFNTLSWERTGIVETNLPEGDSNIEVFDELGMRVPSRGIRTMEGGHAVRFLAAAVPSMGYKTFYYKEVNKSLAFNNSAIYDIHKIENEFFVIEINHQGHLTRLFDKKKQREVLKAGREGNVLQIFEDKPTQMEKDAWMVDTKREDRGYEVLQTEEITISENKELYTSVKVLKLYNKSSIELEMIIYHDQPIIEFKHTVDWHEKHKMLRVLFPVDINATSATYDIAYGTIERNTHTSTSYEHARFETPAHKWADLSEGDYGVALLNDCKYGYSIIDGEIQLSLLRAPTFPDPQADEGQHTFVFSLYPHDGGWREANVAHKAFEMNVPMLCVPGEAPKKQRSFLSVDRKNIIIDCLKKAENSDDIIVRLYETHNARSLVELSFNFDIHEVQECDLLENNLCLIPVQNNKIYVQILPYEIKTFRIKM